MCWQVRHLYICDFHKNFIQSVRNKRKRKTSDDGGESPDHDVEVPEVTWTQMLVQSQLKIGSKELWVGQAVGRMMRSDPMCVFVCFFRWIFFSCRWTRWDVTSDTTSCRPDPGSTRLNWQRYAHLTCAALCSARRTSHQPVSTAEWQNWSLRFLWKSFWFSKEETVLTGLQNNQSWRVKLKPQRRQHWSFLLINITG